jgi:hypothetical protein
MATLGGKPVRWKVDKTGKGSWKGKTEPTVKPTVKPPVRTAPKPAAPAPTPEQMRQKAAEQQAKTRQQMAGDSRMNRSSSSSSSSSPSPSSSSSSSSSSASAPSAPKAKPKLSAKDTATNTEYDRLRNQPGGKKADSAAAKFGMAASKAKFGNQLKPKTPNPLLAHYEPEGEQIDEVLGGKPGDGYIGHPNLDIKNPLAKKQTKGPTGNQGVAGKLGDRKMRIDSMMKQLNQSVEHSGVTFSESELEAIQAKVDAWDNDSSVTEGSDGRVDRAYATDGHGNRYRDYKNDGVSDRQRRMSAFAQKRTQMLNQPKLP